MALARTVTFHLLMILICVSIASALPQPMGNGEQLSPRSTSDDPEYFRGYPLSWGKKEIAEYAGHEQSQKASNDCLNRHVEILLRRPVRQV